MSDCSSVQPFANFSPSCIYMLILSLKSEVFVSCNEHILYVSHDKDKLSVINEEDLLLQVLVIITL